MAKKKFPSAFQIRAAIPGLLKIAGNEAVEFFTGNISNQVDVNGKSFKTRRFDIRKRAGRGVMNQTGRLKRSIKIGAIGSDFVKIVSDVPYARIHNYGGRIRVTPQMRAFFWSQYYESGKTSADAKFWRGMALKKNGSINIPQRKFMGSSNRLKTNISRKMNAKLKTILK